MAHQGHHALSSDATIEKIIKASNARLSMDVCQAGSVCALKVQSGTKESTQEHLIAFLVTDPVVERERIDQGITPCQLRWKLIVQGLKISLASLKRVRMATSL